MQTFEQKPFHFGFVLGLNTASTYIDYNNYFADSDSAIYIRAKQSLGFVLAPVVTLHANKNIYIRLTAPKVSFQDKIVEYQFLNSDNTFETYEKKINSVYVGIPLDIKLRTDRIRNFAPYALFGFKWERDLTGRKEDQMNSTLEDYELQVSKTNLAYAVGGGIDFFLEYFKFGLELKLNVGINDIRDKTESNQFWNPISKMRTQMWQLSFTFEGGKK